MRGPLGDEVVERHERPADGASGDSRPIVCAEVDERIVIGFHRHQHRGSGGLFKELSAATCAASRAVVPVSALRPARKLLASSTIAAPTPLRLQAAPETASGMRQPW